MHPTTEVQVRMSALRLEAVKHGDEGMRRMCDMAYGYELYLDGQLVPWPDAPEDRAAYVETIVAARIHSRAINSRFGKVEAV